MNCSTVGKSFISMQRRQACRQRGQARGHHGRRAQKTAAVHACILRRRDCRGNGQLDIFSGLIRRERTAVTTGCSGCGPGAGWRPGNFGECGLWQLTQILRSMGPLAAVPIAAGAAVGAGFPVAIGRAVATAAQELAVREVSLRVVRSRVCSRVEVGFVVAVETVVVSVVAAVAHHDVRMFLRDDQFLLPYRIAAAAACLFHGRRSNRSRTNQHPPARGPDTPGAPWRC